MIALPIGPRIQRYACGASPAYLDIRGRPEHPKDLLRHRCIRHRFASGIALPWEFERDGETVRVSPEGPLTANTLELELSAAVAGLAVIASFEAYLRPAFERGELEPILETWWPAFPGPFLYYAGRQHIPGPLRAFVDFVRSQADNA